MDAMETSRNTGSEPAASGAARWQAVINWAALLMLLAGSVVWPR